MHPVTQMSPVIPDRRQYRAIRLTGLAILAGLCALPASAAGDRHALYKCVDKGGVISIQSSACAAGSTQAWRRDATPEAALTPGQLAQADAKRRHDQQVVRELSEQLDRRMREAAAPTPTVEAAAAPPVTAPAASAEAENPDLKACQDAQDFANLVRAKEWLGLSDAQVQRLYGWVARECKVSGGG